MGNFSYISKNHKEPVINPWHVKTYCELQLLVEGKVVEKMRGIYNGYGAVDIDSKFEHFVLVEGDIWKNITEETFQRAKTNTNSGETWISQEWDSIVSLHFGEDMTSGIAAWHLNSMTEVVPDATTRSEDDENQGDIFNHYDDEEDEEDGEDGMY